MIKFITVLPLLFKFLIYADGVVADGVVADVEASDNVHVKVDVYAPATVEPAGIVNEASPAWNESENSTTPTCALSVEAGALKIVAGVEVRANGVTAVGNSAAD